jgi:hypothetical protein
VARTIENEALGWLGLAWRVSQMVKPVRTIDQLVIVLGDLRARSAAPTASEMQVRGELEAARVATRSLSDSGADDASLEAMRQRVAVLEEVQAPVADADPLSGSLNARARPDVPPVAPDASLQSAGAPRGALAVAEAFRSVAAGLAGTGDDRRLATARLAGQKEALRTIAASLETQMEADAGEAGDRLRTTVQARLEAIDAAAAALTPVRAPSTPAPTVTPPVARRGARTTRTRRREAIPLAPEPEE